MGFTAEPVPNMGLEFYIHQIEALAAPEFISGGRLFSTGKETQELVALRKEIWEHVQQTFTSARGATRQKAIDAAIEMAKKLGYGIVDIVDIDSE